MSLTHERLLAVLSYDKATGLFVRLRTKKVTGSGNGYGYLQIRVDGVEYSANRLAWFYENGDWPKKGMDLDHINGVRNDNRIENLRLATRSQNCQNRTRLHIGNTSGTTGVYWDKKQERWRALIGINGRRKHLGRFDTKEDAVEYRELAKAMIHPFSCPNARV